MTLFELKFLEPAKDYTSPFPHDPEGFTDTWWIPNIDMPYYDDLGGTKLIQFLVDHVEVGRAKITDWWLFIIEGVGVVCGVRRVVAG